MAASPELYAKKNAKEREIASTRGEAQAMTAVGLAGGAGWAALELLAVTDVPKTKKSWRLRQVLLLSGLSPMPPINMRRPANLKKSIRTGVTESKTPAVICYKNKVIRVYA